MRQCRNVEFTKLYSEAQLRENGAIRVKLILCDTILNPVNLHKIVNLDYNSLKCIKIYNKIVIIWPKKFV